MPWLVAAVCLQVALIFLVAPAVYVMWTSMLLDAPFWPTRTAYFPHIIESLHIRQSDVVYELGSGDGRFLLACAQAHQGVRHVGVEHNYFLHCLALLRNRYVGNPPNVTFVCGDIFAIELHGATRIYAYLLPSVMDRLLSKFERECAGARIASSAFPMTLKAPVEVVTLSQKQGLHGQHLLYVYEF